MLSDLPQGRRWHSQTMPAPIVVALIQRDLSAEPGAAPVSHTLLIRRNGRPYNGQWALVGGKWEFGETLAGAIEREVLEESGLVAQFTAVRQLISERVYPTGPEEQGAHFFIILCELHAAAGQPSEQAEGEVRWFTAAELQALHEAGQVVPSDFAMIAHYQAEMPPAAVLIEAEMRAAVQDDEPGQVTLLRFTAVAPLD